MEESDFLKKFYNLEGESVSERKKNFFKLLRSQRTSLNEEDLKNLQPRTYLDKLFQVDIFIYFKIYAKVLDLMRNGNKAFIKKILKHPQILKETVENIPAEKFVKDFFPSISYSTRMKILNKIYLIMNASQMDEIIFWLEKEYGLNIAIKVLHTCSSAKIKDFLCNYEVILSSKQIKFIFDKDPELFVYYLNYYKTLTATIYIHSKLSRYVAVKNPKVWLHLQGENAISWVTLGYRTSRKIIQCNKKEFLSHVKYYSDFVRMDIIVQELQDSFEGVYLDFFPKDKRYINTNNFCHRLLSYYPKHKRWDVFEQTFQKVFKSNILDDLIYLNHSFIALFTNKFVKNAWAQANYLKERTNYFLKYCDTKMAIPLITDKISNTLNTEDTAELVEFLLENCAENEDLISLEGVLQFLCIKYLEDNVTNTEDLYNILCHVPHKIIILFKLEQFNDNHWTRLNKILTFMRETDKTEFYYFTDVSFCDLKYIEHLCVQGKPFQNELETFIRNINDNNTWFHINLGNPEIEKRIWIETIKTYSDLMEMDEKISNNFIKCIIDFNEEHPDSTIDISNFPNLLNYLLLIFDEDSKTLEYDQKDILERVISYNYKFPDKPIIALDEDRILEILWGDNKYFARENAMEEMVTKKNRSRFENEVLNMFWENIVEYRYLNRRIITWFLINEPGAVVPYFDQILEIDKTSIDISYVKLLSHLDFDKKLINHCITKLESIDSFLKSIGRKKVCKVGSEDFTDKFEKQTKFNAYAEIIRILSILLTASDYIDIFKRFLSLEGRKKTTEKSLNTYFLQCEVVKYIKNLDESTTVLPTVIQFCLGDCLTSALCSLYSICYRTPEETLYSYIDQLSKAGDKDDPRKHGMYLSCELLNYNYVLNGLRKATEKTICPMHVFQSTLKYFRKNPSDELLNIVTSTLNTPDIIIDNDKQNIIRETWRFFENLRRKGLLVQHYLIIILNIVIGSKDILVSLPIDFCRYIITNYFQVFPQRDHCLNNIQTFVCLVLRNEQLEQNYNFKIVFDIIIEFEKNKHTEAIKKFFYHFYEMALQDIHTNKQIDENSNYHIELFKQHWFLIFNYINMFDECVLLDLLFFRCKSSDKIENYARDVTVYLKKLSDEFGPHIYDSVQNILLYKHTFTENDKFSFYYNMLLNAHSSINYILILNLLEQSTSNDETGEIYLKIIEILKSSSDSDVQVRLNNYLEKRI